MPTKSQIYSEQLKDNQYRKYNYPSHLIDPAQKNKAWVLQYIKAMHNNFMRLDYNIFYNNRDQYLVNRQYAYGNQDINQYKERLDCTDRQNESWLNLDWSIFRVIPKFRNIILGKMEKLGYNIVCTSIDKQAVSQKRKEKNRMVAKTQLMDFIKEIEKESKLKLRQPTEPEDLEELELQMQLNPKENMEISMEEALELVFYENDWKEISKAVRKDLIDLGIGATKDYIDSNGFVKIRRVDPMNLITSYSESDDFKYIQEAGEIIKMTISDLKQLAGDQFTELEYEAIAKHFRNRQNNLLNQDYQFNSATFYHAQLAYYYDDYVIQVMECEFFSYNELAYEKGKNKYGNSSPKKQSYGSNGSDNSKISRKNFKVKYGGSWIIGTSYIFNAGLKPRGSGLADPRLSYHIYAPNMQYMNTISLVEMMTPIANQIQLLWLKMQSAIAKAVPKGVKVEIGALENIPKGKGAENFKPLEVIDLYYQTGTLLFRMLDDEGKMVAQNPITEMEGGMANDVMNFMNLIKEQYGFLRDITGVNEAVDASTPSPKMLKSVAEMAIIGANNALQFLFSADKYLLEETAKSCALNIQTAIKKGAIKGYIEAIGEPKAKFIEVNSDISLNEFAIKIESKPDDAEKAMLEQDIQTSLNIRRERGTGGIELEDAYAIRRIDNVKLAEQYLVLKRKKRAQKDELIAKQNSEQNAQLQQQSAMATAQAQKETQLDIDNSKIKVETAKSKLRMDEMDKKYGLEMELARVQGNIKGGQIEQEADIGLELEETKQEGKTEKVA